MTIAFDTLQAAKHLQEAGIEQQQAEAIVQIVNDQHEELSTKSDIKQVEQNINARFERQERNFNANYKRPGPDLKKEFAQLRWLVIATMAAVIVSNSIVVAILK